MECALRSKILMLAMTMSVAIMSFNAQAGFIAIDSFDTGDQFISLNGTATSGTETVLERTLSAELLAFANPVQSSAEVSFGSLTVTNGSAEDSEVRVSWGFDASLLPVGSGNYQFLFNIVESDGNDTDLEFFYNGLSFADFAIPGNTINQNLSFGVSTSSLASSGVLELVINGDPGWDFQLDSIGLSFSDPVANNVPEPSTLALFALGLFGAAAARRRV